MAEPPVEHLLPGLADRREYFDYLDRWAVGTVDELKARLTTRALSKAFLLETSRNGTAVDVVTALGRDADLSAVDSTLYRMRLKQDPADWALVEIEDDRYPIIYTLVPSDIANRRVSAIVSDTPGLDRAWFSASMFLSLWDVVRRGFPPHRFSRIVFEHESVYQRYEGPGDDIEETAEDDDSEDERFAEIERRRARIQVSERIGKLHEAVLPWKGSYDPLASIVQLRIPAPGRGGHDVFFDGRFTNRGESMSAFRQTVRDVLSIYRASTEAVEAESWPRDPGIEDGPYGSIGAPLLIKFGEELDQDVFDRWIASLRRKNNRFRLWGKPLSRGPGKVHFYAVDHHLWQPVDIEITRAHLYALLPKGTCGNTVHRLVTNVQRLVAPKVEVFIGERPYEHFLASQSAKAGEDGA